MGNQPLEIEEGQTMQYPPKKRTQGQRTIYKTLHIKLKLEEHKLHQKPEGNTIT